MDIQRFQSNRERFSATELAKFGGKFVAWKPDGTGIIAADDDELALSQKVRTSGFNGAEILIAFVPRDDEVMLGGGMEIEE